MPKTVTTTRKKKTITKRKNNKEKNKKEKQEYNQERDSIQWTDQLALAFVANVRNRHYRYAAFESKDVPASSVLVPIGWYRDERNMAHRNTHKRRRDDEECGASSLSSSLQQYMSPNNIIVLLCEPRRLVGADLRLPATSRHSATYIHAATYHPPSAEYLRYHSALAATNGAFLYRVPLSAFLGVEEHFFPHGYKKMLEEFVREDAALRVARMTAPLLSNDFFGSSTSGTSGNNATGIKIDFPSSERDAWPLRIEPTFHHGFFESILADTSPPIVDRIETAANEELARVLSAYYGPDYKGALERLSLGARWTRAYHRYFDSLRRPLVEQWKAAANELAKQEAAAVVVAMAVKKEMEKEELEEEEEEVKVEERRKK